MVPVLNTTVAGTIAWMYAGHNIPQQTRLYVG